MKHKVSNRIISVLLAFVMVVGLIPAATMPVRAQNITGLMYASGIRANEGVVLYGDTTLNMDTDLTVPYIEGDYNLTIEGSGRLTVNGSGNGIDVKSLNCSSDLFIQTGWHAIEVSETVYIHNADSFIVGGIYAGGHINIQSNNATIAGNDYAISSALGSITLSGGTFDIGANGVAVFANVGDITMDGDFTVNSNNGRTIDTAKGEVVIEGSLKSTSGAKFDPEVHFANRDWFSIGAASGFSFYGTTLEVTGLGGILAGVNAGYADISITADSVSITTERYYALYGNYIYVDSDELWLENEGSEENENVIYDFDTVYAEKDVTLSSESGGIVGEIALTVFGTLTLNGNFVAGGDSDHDNPLVITNRMEANGKLVLRNSTGLAVDASESFLFNGTTLDIEGFGGIDSDGDVNITADSVVITTDVGDAISGNEVYVTANDLWAENKATKAGDGTRYGISANSKLALTVKGGTVIGYDDALHVYDENDQFEFHYIYVNGHLTAVSQTGVGMYAPQGTVELYGGPIVSVGESHGINAKDVVFEGGSLRVEGDTGIYAIRSVELSGDNIQITAFNERRSGIWVENGYVDLEGKVNINTNGWYGINAGTDLSFHKGYYEISGPKGNAQAVMVGGELYMDGTLEIIQPDGGHVNGNEIYGAGDSPALELEMYSAIPEVSLLIDGPREGKLPTRNPSGIYFLDTRCTVESIVWYEDGEEMVSQDALFRAGHRYTVKITLSADDPYRFVDGVMGKVNGKAVTTGMLGGDKKGMILTADLGECAYAISAVELEITAPVEGKTPSTSVTDYGAAYGVYSRDVRWGVSTDGVNFTIMAAGEKFVGGKYYRVFMDVNLLDGLNGNGYKFPVTTADGTVQPDVVATVNGSPAVVEKAYDQDPEEVITVYFDFGKCNDFIIEEVTIVDVVAPVAGQRPTYTANMFGTGYHIDTTKNSYEDIYWKNPPEKWYYVKNGVQWWDTTTGIYEYVYENDTFIPGHTYSCTIYVCVDDGFTFARSNGETLLTATINGNTANIVTGWTDTWNTRVTYTFTCEMPTVSTIQVYDIDVPKADNLPDYTATLANPDLYQLDTDYGLNGSGIYWYDCEGRQLEAGEVFGDAGPYRMAIKFVPVYKDGAPLCTFANDVNVLLNGKYVTPHGEWDDIVVGSGAVWAFYTFTGYSSAPELGSCTISGNVTSYGDGILTLELIPKNQTTPISMGTFDSNGSYSFWGLAVGVYTLRVSKPNHVTREYIVVVTTDVVQNVEINLIGDTTGDGKVNMKDWSRLYDHISETNPLEDYNLLCADVTGDGKVNMKDWSRLYDHISELNPLW